MSNFFIIFATYEILKSCLPKVNFLDTTILLTSILFIEMRPFY